MKKNYIAPNSKVVNIRINLMQAASVTGTNLDKLTVGGTTNSADSRRNKDWDDDEEEDDYNY